MKADQDSPTDGKKVVLTSGMPGTWEDLMKHFQKNMKDPVDPMMRWALKDIQVEMESDTAFTVKVINDGELMEDIGGGNGSKSDCLVGWTKFTLDFDTGLITCEDGIEDPMNAPLFLDTAPEFKLARTMYHKLNKDMTIESWVVAADGTRDAGEDFAKVIEGIMKAVATDLTMQYTKWEAEADAIRYPGPGLKSVIIGPLDDHITRERLWQDCVDWKTIYGELAVVTEISETEVMINFGSADMGSLMVELDKEKGEIVSTFKISGKLCVKSTLCILENPLRTECWEERWNGQRVANEPLAKTLAITTETAILKYKNSWY